MTSFVTSLFKLDTRLIKNDKFLHKNLKCVNYKKCTVENSFVTTQSFEKTHLLIMKACPALNTVLKF